MTLVDRPAVDAFGEQPTETEPGRLWRHRHLGEVGLAVDHRRHDPALDPAAALDHPDPTVGDGAADLVGVDGVVGDLLEPDAGEERPGRHLDLGDPVEVARERRPHLRGRREQRDRDPEPVQGQDAPPRLHGPLRWSRGVAGEGGRHVEIDGGAGETPGDGRAGSVREVVADEFEDGVAEPEGRLAGSAGSHGDTAHAAQHQAGVDECGGGAVDIGRAHHQLVEGDHPVGVRHGLAARRRRRGGHERHAVEIAGVESRDRQRHDSRGWARTAVADVVGAIVIAVAAGDAVARRCHGVAEGNRGLPDRAGPGAAGVGGWHGEPGCRPRRRVGIDGDLRELVHAPMMPGVAQTTEGALIDAR